MPTKGRSLVLPPNLDKLGIVLLPDPGLKRTCLPVESFEPELKAFTDRMLVLMKEGKGIGLAAPQVGVPLRLFVCNTTGEPEDDLVCVNPRLSDLTGAEVGDEGCLSIPGVTVAMRRATSVVMNALDTHGQPYQRHGEGLWARVWQHENDHLDGRMITDNMSPTDEIANRRAIKQLEADYAQLRRKKKTG